MQVLKESKKKSFALTVVAKVQKDDSTSTK